MSEKFKFDLSKIGDQKKISKLPKEEQDKISDDAQEEANAMLVKIEGGEAGNYNNAEKLVEKEKFELNQNDILLITNAIKEFRSETQQDVVENLINSLAKNTSKRSPELIKSIKAIVSLYKEYPQLLGIILLGLDESARANNNIEEEINFLKLDEIFDLLVIFEKDMAGREGTQASRAAELIIWKKDKAFELLPKYCEVMLKYLNSPGYANRIARDITYEEGLEESKKLLDFYSKEDVIASIYDSYNERCSIRTDLRRMISEKTEYQEWLEYFEKKLTTIDKILNNAKSIEDFADIHQKLGEFKEYEEYNGKTGWINVYLKMAKKSNLINDKQEADLGIKIKELYKKLKSNFDEKSNSLIGEFDISKDNEKRLREILEDYITQSHTSSVLSSADISFDWNKNICSYKACKTCNYITIDINYLIDNVFSIKSMKNDFKVIVNKLKREHKIKEKDIYMG